MPTFRNISTIDFLLVTNDLKYDVSRPAVQYVPRCDHSAISINLLFGTQRSGPGIWRCNPYLVQDLSFRKELKSFCDAASRYIPDLDAPSQWDHFKIVLKGFIQAFFHKLHAKHRRKEVYLQRQRHKLIRHHQHEHAAEALSHIEAQLDQIAEFSANTLALRLSGPELKNRLSTNFFLQRDIWFALQTSSTIAPNNFTSNYILLTQLSMKR
ncbi:hypothetical protein G6F46_013340 [Rhizopus delemar]|nr:hypothetical protein G6F46_013340 [Rhizopus delemar]